MSEVQDIETGDVADTNAKALVDPAAQVIAYYEHMKGLAESADDVDVPAKVLQAILNATTAEDILRAGEAMPATELLDIPMRVTGIRASESGFEEGADYYLHVDAILIGNGDTVTFSCGASDVCMKLIAMDMRNLLPASMVITRAKKPTKAGFFPLFARAVDDEGKPF